MALEHLKNLLSQLGESIRMPEPLQPDSEGYCCLSFDEKIVVHIQSNSETEMLMLFCEIGEIGENKKTYVFNRLLESNVFWLGTSGGTLGFNTPSNKVTLGYQEYIRSVDFQRFQQFLETFVNTCEKWMDKLVELQNEADNVANKALSDSESNANDSIPMGMMV